MKHRAHLKQKNKLFKKNKSQKKKKCLKNTQKKKKKNVVEKYSQMLYKSYQAYSVKTNKLKYELKEKSKHIPLYNCLTICLLPFHEDVDILSFKKEFIKYLCEHNGDDDTILLDNIKLYNIYTIHADRKKKRRSFVVYDVPRNIYGIIDGTKCADLILCIFKDGTLENSAFDELGYELLSVLKIQGVPSVIGVGYNTGENNKHSQKFVSRYFNSEFTPDDKIFFISSNGSLGVSSGSDSGVDCHFQKLYYEIMNMKVKNVSYREGRGYMMADSCTYNPNNDSIYIKGFVKGVGFNVNNPVHITNIGDYYLDNIYVIDVLKEKKINKEERNYASSSLIHLNQNTEEEKSEHNFITNFLISDKCTSKVMNYNYTLIQDSRNKTFLNDEDDLICVRPYCTEENNLYENNLMTLKNKDFPNLSIPELIGHPDDNANVGCGNVYGDIEDTSGGSVNMFNASASLNCAISDTCVTNRNLEQSTNDVNNMRRNYGYKYTNGMSDTNTIMFMSHLNETNIVDSVPGNKCRNTWMYVSNEKHEANDNAVCSYDKYETTNGIKKCCDNYFLNNEDVSDGSSFSGETSSSEGSEGGKVEDDAGVSDYSDENRDNDDCVYLSRNMNARERFGRYRSLQSLRTSYIDVYEDLPLEYSRVYDYESPENLIKYSKRKYTENCRIVGGRFTLTDAYCLFVIKNDGKLLNLMRNYGRKELPFILSSLLPYERKVTVVNMEIERTSSYLEKIESKEIFEIVSGFRHFISRPIFSEQIIKGVQSKGKYERSMKHGKKYIASIFGFTTVTSSPVFFIKKKTQQNRESCNRGSMSQEGMVQELCIVQGSTGASGHPSGGMHSHDGTRLSTLVNVSEKDEQLEPYIRNGDSCDITSFIVAHGKVANCDCKRVIMKRVSICGKIFKIHKKKAVIRNMFYNPKDINYFKPVELHTKFGLTGKILESLGTHGKMKCLFSNVLKQHDKVFIFLYKRVYPKWFPLTWGGDPQLGPDDKPMQHKSPKKN
ncbi:ribosome biogenesis protein TSR1, putative [Plasmodium ovale]|uniref:Ribosome biogenesis protein TSR1, putative n=2 Tax=Plasmodium ovale TaxID=36330 RepID=A0A1D3TLB7_PLAOA|nr:ribosome biogenesis protein TSR1, putative (TSR1) [Plasmodium ovale curtisi]SBS97041.1 ribosome biogenesis protein TSR1, putative (TSR1) [Plasmodium ovale curtisi]SCP05764.1 ribosome biogenesis protein TSR1, putative [Plasmodium ovale]